MHWPVGRPGQRREQWPGLPYFFTFKMTDMQLLTALIALLRTAEQSDDPAKQERAARLAKEILAGG